MEEAFATLTEEEIETGGPVLPCRCRPLIGLWGSRDGAEKTLSILWKDVMQSEKMPKIPSDTITNFHRLSSREKAIPCHDWWWRSGLL